MSRPIAPSVVERGPTIPSTPEDGAQLSVNPFSSGGQMCAADLDYEHGFPRLFLSESDAQDTSKFRVDVTSFRRENVQADIKSGPRRTINKASSLITALKDGSIPSAKPHVQSSSRRGTTLVQRLSNTQVATGFGLWTTIVTIPQTFSGGPLNITRAAMQQLITELDLPTSFLPVIYAFGSVPRISEAGLDCFTQNQHPHDAASFSLNYLYRFKDKDQDGPIPASEWKDRQIGVFHRHCASTGEDLFVILQPHANSAFDGAIEDDVQTNGDAMATLMQNPLCLHQLLISTYFSGWREYLRDVADEFSKCSAQAFSQDIVKDYNLDFDFLQQWRNTIDNVVPIGATLDSTRRIVNGLRELQEKHVSKGALQSNSDLDAFFQTIDSQTEGLLRSALSLQKRVENIAELMTNTIESKNQLDAATLNRHMERLTLDTVDDSTSVKIITYLSLVYLPGSFVATLFGMNLFGFDQDVHKIAIAKNFWLYIVIFVPLTAITFAGAWMLSDRAKKRRDERNRLLGVLSIRDISVDASKKVR